eukprot:784325_1
MNINNINYQHLRLSLLVNSAAIVSLTLCAPIARYKIIQQVKNTMKEYPTDFDNKDPRFYGYGNFSQLWNGNIYHILKQQIHNAFHSKNLISVQNNLSLKYVRFLFGSLLESIELSTSYPLDTIRTVLSIGVLHDSKKKYLSRLYTGIIHHV